MVQTCPECGSHWPAPSFNSTPSRFCALKHLPTHSRHFQEYAAQPPKDPTIEIWLWWTAAKQEACSTCISVLVRPGLSIWVKCWKGTECSLNTTGTAESRSVKNWAGRYRKQTGELSWQVWYDETELRGLWKGEAWEIMMPKADASCMYDCLSAPCCLCLRPFPSFLVKAQQRSRSRLSLWQDKRFQRVQRQACTDQE